MPVLARPPSQVQPEQLEGQSSWTDAYRSAFQETLETGPLGSITTAVNLNAAEGGIASYGDEGSLTRQRKLSPMVSLANAKQQVKDAGLEGQVPLGYPQGLRQETLSMLIDLNKDKVRRQTLSSQYDGWTPQVAGMIAGSIVDPANIALSAIPVVGEARYAQLLKGASGVAGRFAVRARVGALEGLVGAAAAEPFIYLGQQEWRNDYDAFDSMLNIAGGAAFGALLHAGAGLATDRFGARVGEPTIEADANRLREAIDIQNEVAATGRAPDWMRPIDADRADIEARLASGGEPPAPRAAHLQPAALAGEPVIPEGMVRVYHGGAVEPSQVSGEQFATNARERGQGYADKAEGSGKLYYTDLPADDPRVAQNYPGEQFDPVDVKLTKAEARNLKPLETVGAATPASVKIVDEPGDPALKLPPDVRPFLAGLDQRTHESILRMAIGQALQRQKIDVTPAMLGDPLFRANPAAYKAAREGAVANASSVDGADARASQAATDKLQGPEHLSLEDAKALLADEEAIYREAGGDLDSLDIDSPDGDLTVGAGKGFGLCRLRSDA